MNIPLPSGRWLVTPAGPEHRLLKERWIKSLVMLRWGSQIVKGMCRETCVKDRPP